MEENKPISIIIADDHYIIRMGLKMRLKSSFNVTVYEASNGEELFNLVKKQVVDLVIMDINMPSTSSQDILNSILSLQPELNVLIFSVNKEEIYGKLYMKLGARGYLQKDATDEEIFRAVRSILAGNVYIRREMQGFYLGTGNSGGNSYSPYSVLTKKELEILRYIYKGEGALHIAKIMNLSPSTIATHKANIFSKLQTANIVELRELISLHPLE